MSSKSARLVQEIAAASQEQAGGVGQINAAVTQLSQTTQQNAAASEELAATSEEMAGRAEELQQTMACFRVKSDSRVMRKPVIAKPKTVPRKGTASPVVGNLAVDAEADEAQFAPFE